MFKLLFIRHGESTGNQYGLIAGHLADGLTPQGQQQCRRLAAHLQAAGWPSHIYCSPLRRAMDSLSYLIAPWDEEQPSMWVEQQQGGGAESLSPDRSGEPTSPPITITEALAEFQAGILTGLTWTAAKVRYPDLCRALETGPDWVAIPGAESPLDGRERANTFLHQLFTRHQGDDTVWVMTHHWIMEHLIASLLGCDRTWQLTIPNTAVFEFWLDYDRWFQPGMPRSISNYWQIKRFGDCSHLTSGTLRALSAAK